MSNKTAFPFPWFEPRKTMIRHGKCQFPVRVAFFPRLSLDKKCIVESPATDCPLWRWLMGIPYFIFWINMRFGPKASGIPISSLLEWSFQSHILGCRLFHWFTPWNRSKALWTYKYVCLYCLHTVYMYNQTINDINVLYTRLEHILQEKSDVKSLHLPVFQLLTAQRHLFVARCGCGQMGH